MTDTPREDVTAEEEPALVPRAGGAHPVACHFADAMNPLELGSKPEALPADEPPIAPV